jgi:hypothetical protein
MCAVLMRSALAAMCLVLAGCPDRSTAGSHAADTPSAAPSPRGSATSVTALPSASVLKSPDGRALDLARKAIACRWEATQPSQDCEDAKAWREARDVFEGGRADGVLVALLEDADDRARHLAAWNLNVFGERYRTDKALAARVVLAADREKSDRVAAPLGAALSRLDVDRTDTFDRVRAIAMKHALLPLRIALAATLGKNNLGSLPAFTLTLDLLRDPEKDVRASALGALWQCSSRRPDETCRAWRDAIDRTDDDELAARACDYLTWSGACQSSYDLLLDVEEKRFKAQRMAAPEYAKALGNLCEDTRATSTQKSRALELAKRMVEQKATQRYVRSAALEAIVRCDSAGGKAFVQKFGDDDDPFVKERARELLKPKR